MTTVPIETTIRDLENARQALAVTGWHRGNLLDSATGKVCLDGAISLATVMRLCTTARTVSGHRWVAAFIHEYDEENMLPILELGDRHLAALLALSAVLPDTCQEHERVHTVEHDRVFHYNDEHCDGAQEADLLLEQAAEKLRAELPL